MKQQDFEKHIDSYMKVDIELRDIANKYADAFCGGGYIESIEVDYDGVFGTVEVTGSTPTHCGCCPDDYIGFTIPLRYLWEDDWLEQEQAIRDERERKRKEEKRMKKEEKKKKEAEAERRLFEKLKEKYE